VTFADATEADLVELQQLHAAAIAALNARFGEGPWSKDVFGRTLGTMPGRDRLRVGRCNGRIVTSLRLQTKKPWAIDAAYFTRVRRPLYLTGMAVHPDSQRHGKGRQALEDAHAIADAWPADAIRLDAYDAPAGGGAFYAKCGYVERGRVTYRGTPHIYYECLLR
jgi:GNAT superfamily N-acetyltransferase